MKIFTGTVTSGYGMATPNLNPVMSLIETRIGLPNLVPGTLNVSIPEEYLVPADALILPREYPYNLQSHLGETIKLQRCLAAGYQAIIVRPDSHELGAGQFHGKCYLELMAQIHFRGTLTLTDGAIIEVQVGRPRPLAAFRQMTPAFPGLERFDQKVPQFSTTDVELLHFYIDK